MAKAFYSMEEVCELLGKSQDEVKKLVQGGTLREFRDAGKIFFKAEDVDKLAGGSAAASEDSGEITLEPAPEPEEELPSTADDEGTSAIGLEAVKEPEEPAERASRKDTVITASGIGVFDEDELEIDADPMAETQITAGAREDEVSLEGTGSGSGLLDLTREADDTSLGAELLDEIYPGEDESVEPEAPPLPEEPAAEEEAAEEAEPAVAPVAFVETAPAAQVAAGDPSEGLFSGLMVGALILLVVAGSVVAGMLQGFFPDYARFLSNNFVYFLLGAVAVPILAMLIGWVIGKAAVPKRV